METTNINSYLLLKLNRNPLEYIIKTSMDLAKKFMIERKLILTGGMAIDYAMRVYGSKLYEENSVSGMLPDYDCYSPDPVKDAYDFVSILNEKNFTKDGQYRLDAIRATHIQTIRVRLEYESIIEISYVPPIIFNKLPTIKYKDMLVIHPHWQMINIHRALSYPVIDPPREVIFNRINKDVERFMLLYNAYPFKTDISIIKQEKINLAKIIENLYHIKGGMRISDYDFIKKLTYKVKENKDFILFGLTAYPFYFLNYSKIIHKIKSILSDSLFDAFKNIHSSDIELENNVNKEFNFSEIIVPLNEISFITCDIEYISSLENDNEWEKYEPFLDYILPLYKKNMEDEIGKYTLNIFHLYYTYIPISKIEFNNGHVYVTNCNNTLAYLLSQYHRDIEHKDIYITFYISIINMITNLSNYIDKIFAKLDISEIELGSKTLTKEEKQILYMILESPFFISKTLYGSNNKSETMLLSEMQQYNRIMQKNKIQNTEQQVELPPVPERSYMPNNGPRPLDFDYESSIFFRISGEKIKTVDPLFKF